MLNEFMTAAEEVLKCVLKMITGYDIMKLVTNIGYIVWTIDFVINIFRMFIHHCYW